jgi:hypothetical protein
MIVPFEPWHLLEIRHQPWQKGATQTLEHAQAVASGYCAYTAIQQSTGRPLACSGICELWAGRAMCWASLDIDARPAFPAMHRRMKRELDLAPFKRLEMYVTPGFLQAWRWAEMLGFVLEGLMEAGSPDGRDLYVFKRIKRGAVARELGAWNSRQSSLGASKQ